MKCLNCSHINTDGAKFCQECGSPLPHKCTNCGTINDPQAKFCMNCGHPLAVATGLPETGASAPPVSTPFLSSPLAGDTLDQARLKRLAAQTPATLAAKIRSSGHISGERRVVTALFADVVDSTSLAENLDPEDWTGVMNRAFDVLTPIVYRYEGTIARLMGDALLAFFGAPVAHEDDPVRAARAGLDLLEAARGYAGEVRRRYGVDFAIRIGLNTGPVVVGDVGSNLVYEYTAMGDAVNLAARLQSATRPMTLLTAENTLRFIHPFFEYDDLGTIKVKGKAEPVHIYEILHPKATPGSSRGLAGLASPLVGRDQELQALRELAKAVQAGFGRAALIIGEAGLGKSRLLAEWKLAVQQKAGGGEPRLRWAEGRCLSYGQGLAYHLLIDLLRSLIAAPFSAGEGKTQAALNDRVQELFGSQAINIYPYLAHLLALPLEGEAKERVRVLDRQALQAQYLTALRRFIQAQAGRKPLVLILEDIHWADPSSTDLLVKLLPLVKEAPVLFCFLTRPEHEVPGWKLVTAVRDVLGEGRTELHLRALSDRESRQLVSNLLEVEALPEKIRTGILQKAEGNPFFVEEMIRMLIDRGVVVRQGEGWVAVEEVGSLDLPDNLQGLLLARIDRLPEERKHTLRVASVVGRQFPVPVLEEILSDLSKEQLKEHLSSLEAAGLIHLAQAIPDVEFIFRHSLVQDAAYASLLKGDRCRLHLAVGKALEYCFPDRLDELAPVLAGHFLNGGDDLTAFHYLITAGDRAAHTYANTEALEYYNQALNLAPQVNAESDIRFHLFIQRGRALELTAQYSLAEENYQEMGRLAQEQGDAAMHLTALMACATLYAVPTSLYNSKRAKSLCEQALSLAQELGDRAAEARIYWILLLSYDRSNMPFEAVTYGEKALALARELDLADLIAYILNDIGQGYLAIGKPRKGYEALKEAQQRWRQYGNLPMLADSITTTGLIEYFLGDLNQAIRSAEEGYQLSSSIQNLWGQSYSRMYISYPLVEKGELGQAIRCMEDCIQLSFQAGFLAPLATILADLGWVYALIGRIDHGLSLARQALENAEKEIPSWQVWSRAALTRIYSLQGDFPLAEETLKDAFKGLESKESHGLAQVMVIQAEFDLALAKREYGRVLTLAEKVQRMLQQNDFIMLTPFVLLAKGTALLELSELTEAYTALSAAQRRAEELGARRVLWEIFAALAQCSERRGDLAAASQARQSARELVEWMARRIDVPENRAAFLAQPAICSLIEG